MCREELSAVTRCHFTNELRSDHQKTFLMRLVTDPRATVNNFPPRTSNFKISFTATHVIDNRSNLYRSTVSFVSVARLRKSVSKILPTES